MIINLIIIVSYIYCTLNVQNSGHLNQRLSEFNYSALPKIIYIIEKFITDESFHVFIFDVFIDPLRFLV